jgi:hypothetical protein
MGFFDSGEVQCLRAFWYEVYCAARGFKLNMLRAERTVGEYYVEYEVQGKRYLTPCSGVLSQQQLAVSLREDPDVKKIKLSVISLGSAAEMISAIRASGKT